MKMPVVSGKEVIRVLLKNGFSIKRQKGSHVHLVKRDVSPALHVTVHGNKDLNKVVIRSIARQAGYTMDEFTELF